MENLYFWCKKNEANGTNIRNGKVWTYNSAKAFQELFPYMKISKIYRCLKHLENEGLIEVGCYNSNRYIQTRWYSVTKKALLYFEKSILQNEKWELQNEKSNIQNVEMNITDINTDNKPNISTDNCACSFSLQEMEEDYNSDFKMYYEIMNKGD